MVPASWGAFLLQNVLEYCVFHVFENRLKSSKLLERTVPILGPRYPRSVGHLLAQHPQHVPQHVPQHGPEVYICASRSWVMAVVSQRFSGHRYACSAQRCYDRVPWFWKVKRCSSSWSIISLGHKLNRTTTHSVGDSYFRLTTINRQNPAPGVPLTIIYIYILYQLLVNLFFIIGWEDIDPYFFIHSAVSSKRLGCPCKHLDTYLFEYPGTTTWRPYLKEEPQKATQKCRRTLQRHPGISSPVGCGDLQRFTGHSAVNQING